MHTLRGSLRMLVFGCLTGALVFALSPWTISSQTSPSPEDTVKYDETTMGPYRALAQLIMQAFKKNDMETALTLGKILNRTWNKGENNNDEKCLSKANPELYQRIDRAMDTFNENIEEIQEGEKTRDIARVEGLYNKYLAQLKLADGEFKGR